MAYYVLATVKSDLGISNTDYDSVLAILGANADSEVDEQIKIVTKRTKKSTLPDLPLTTVPQTIIEASHALIKSLFFSRPDNLTPDLVKINYDIFKRKIELYVTNQRDTNEIAGEIF